MKIRIYICPRKNSKKKTKTSSDSHVRRKKLKKNSEIVGQMRRKFVYISVTQKCVIQIAPLDKWIIYKNQWIKRKGK